MDEIAKSWFEEELGELVEQGKIYPEDVQKAIDKATELEKRVADLEAENRKLECDLKKAQTSSSLGATEDQKKPKTKKAATLNPGLTKKAKKKKP